MNSRDKTETVPLETVSLELGDDGVAVLWIHDRINHNAFTEPMVQQLLTQLERLEQDPAVKVCVVRGLPDVFCAGAHQDMLLALARGQMAATDIVLSRYLLDVPVPTIAAMEGHAVGGGLALGLCCDMLLMARESRYGCSFMNLGFTPGMGITRLLQDAVGEYIAAEMMFGGQMFKGSQLEARSSINHVLPRARVLGKAMQLARRIAEKPRGALELLKRTLSVRRRQAFEQARTSEGMMHKLSFADPNTARRIQENYVRTATTTAREPNKESR